MFGLVSFLGVVATTLICTSSYLQVVSGTSDLGVIVSSDKR